MEPLPTYARRRVRQNDPTGLVEAIQTRPTKRAPMLALDAWDLTLGAEEGRPDARAVSLFQYEHLATIATLLDTPVGFAQTRRNLAVRGFNLEAARGERVRVGGAILEITGRCHPCSRMNETIGPGAFVAMYGYGGFVARIVEPGWVRLGDVVRLADV